MFKRSEIESALESTGVLNDHVFEEFLNELRLLNPHMLYSARGHGAIEALVYNKESFDCVVSSLLVIYNEIMQSREPISVNTIYTDFFKSSFLKDLKSIGTDNLDNNDDGVNSDVDVVKEIIILLNLFNKRNKL